MSWFLRPIHFCRWIFSCFGDTQLPDSPVPFVWVKRDYISQDALLCKGRKPEGSGGGRSVLQRRPREAFLWPPRNWTWQLWRRLLCTDSTLLYHSIQSNVVFFFYNGHIATAWLVVINLSWSLLLLNVNCISRLLTISELSGWLFIVL